MHPHKLTQVVERPHDVSEGILIHIVVSIVFHPYVLHVVSQAQQAQACQWNHGAIIVCPPRPRHRFPLPKTPLPGVGLHPPTSPIQRHRWPGGRIGGLWLVSGWVKERENILEMTESFHSWVVRSSHWQGFTSESLFFTLQAFQDQVAAHWCISREICHQVAVIMSHKPSRRASKVENDCFRVT